MYCSLKGVYIETFNMHCGMTAQNIEWEVLYYIISYCPRRGITWILHTKISVNLRKYMSVCCSFRETRKNILHERGNQDARLSQEVKYWNLLKVLRIYFSHQTWFTNRETYRRRGTSLKNVFVDSIILCFWNLTAFRTLVFHLLYDSHKVKGDQN